MYSPSELGELTEWANKPMWSTEDYRKTKINVLRLLEIVCHLETVANEYEYQGRHVFQEEIWSEQMRIVDSLPELMQQIEKEKNKDPNFDPTEMIMIYVYGLPTA